MEILSGVGYGLGLEKAFEELSISAHKTYEGNTYFDDKTQIWKLSNEDYDKLCEIKEEDWKDDWGWWRGAIGSNMCSQIKRYSINHHYMLGWDGYKREEMEKENKSLSPKDRYYEPRKYETLLRYIVNEIGASTEKNVCAICVDLARINNITMGELFRGYQGQGG